MRTVARIAIAVGLALPLSGCVYALQPYNKPGSEKLHIVTSKSGQYAIRIRDGPALPVPSDGRAVVDIPALPRGCSVYMFGFIKVGDGSPERVRAIHVLRDGKVARRLSRITTDFTSFTDWHPAVVEWLPVGMPIQQLHRNTASASVLAVPGDVHPGSTARPIRGLGGGR